MYNIIPFLIIIASVIGIVVLFSRRFSEIATLDVGSIPKERDAQVKKKLIYERYIRSFKKRFSGIWGVSKVFGAKFLDYGLSAKKFLQKLEVKYEKEQMKKMQEQSTDEEGMQSLLDEKKQEKVEELSSRAAESLREDDLHSAEQQYIQAITIDPKNSDAYKGLADVYFEKKEYTLAKETLEHVLKLDKNDAEIYFELGIIAQAADDQKSSWKYFGKALDLNTNNPKYLDAAIHACIALRLKYEATVCLEKLSEVNPENKKIEELRAKIRAI